MKKFKNPKRSYRKYWFNFTKPKIKCNIWWDCTFNTYHRNIPKITTSGSQHTHIFTGVTWNLPICSSSAEVVIVAFCREWNLNLANYVTFSRNGIPFSSNLAQSQGFQKTVRGLRFVKEFQIGVHILKTLYSPQHDTKLPTPPTRPCSAGHVVTSKIFVSLPHTNCV